MSFDPNLCFSDYRIIADRCLRGLGYDESSTIPIDPELIARKLGIRIVPSENLYRQFGIAGFICKYRDEFQIFVDAFHYEKKPEQSIFTIAEELGHFFLHTTKEEQIPRYDEFVKELKEARKFRRYMENQARTLGSNLILPHFVFDAYVLDWVKDNVGQIRKYKPSSSEELAISIADFLEDRLHLSQWVIQITLKRYPDPIIGQVYHRFGKDLLKS